MHAGGVPEDKSMIPSKKDNEGHLLGVPSVALGRFATGDNGHLLAKLDGPQLPDTCGTKGDAET